MRADVAQHRPAPGRARPGRWHHPADDGLDDGRIFQAGRAVHPRRDHRQAARRRRLAWAHRSHRLRRDLHRARGHEAPRAWTPTKSVAAIQGFGNVSQYAAIGFIELLGGKVVCVSYWDRDDRMLLHRQPSRTGIDPRFLMSITDQYGTIDKSKAARSRLHNRRRRRLDQQRSRRAHPRRARRPDQRRDGQACQQPRAAWSPKAPTAPPPPRPTKSSRATASSSSPISCATPAA